MKQVQYKPTYYTLTIQSMFNAITVSLNVSSQIFHQSRNGLVNYKKKHGNNRQCLLGRVVR